MIFIFLFTVFGFGLPDAGTGAVMGVPAHDTRDWDVAHAQGLPITHVLAPPGSAAEPSGTASADEQGTYHAQEAYTAFAGVMQNSGRFTGMRAEDARDAIAAAAAEQGFGAVTKASFLPNPSGLRNACKITSNAEYLYVGSSLNLV